MYVVPLLEKDPDTGARLDYGAFASRLERDVRQKFGSEGSGAKVHIVGFAKLVGDLIDGLMKVLLYFGAAALVAGVIIYSYTRCVRSTALVVSASVVAVVWQLGFLELAGFELDPYSMLVPFLVFAIGVSHGAQKMNGIMQDVGRGTDKYVAARYTFRRLFVAGVTALLADAVGFAVLVIIDVPVIKDLAITASIGVGVLIFTNLLLLPIALSFTGVSAAAARRSLVEEERERSGQGASWLWSTLVKFTTRRWAIGALASAVLLAVVSTILMFGLRIGDLDPGAPELRPNSRYNKDVTYINGTYRLSGDEFVVMVKTPVDGCMTYATLKETENLSWLLRLDPAVKNTFALSDNVVSTIAGLNEGNPKWLSISPNPLLTGGAVHWNVSDNPDAVDRECSVIPLVAYLTDHKSDTLKRVVDTVATFAAAHDEPDRKFLMAAGSAGIEAVTNIVVRDSIFRMYAAVYGAVALLCFITFRSWRAVVVAMTPLVITSVLAKALMVVLGIGLKVATLPVIALGVGIGVDYALYLLSVQLQHQRNGLPLTLAYQRAVSFTGKVVGLVGMTLAAGVVTWAWSPIKFQADMGILLTFMLVWNMVGALYLIPALSHFLLRTPADEPAVAMEKIAAGATRA
jgi:predicted RND superfamily exporter protein